VIENDFKTVTSNIKGKYFGFGSVLHQFQIKSLIPEL